MHTREGGDKTAYNNWNFTTPFHWDSVDNGFWYAPNTTILIYTVTYKIGEK
jgi:hypothetical protein